MLPIPPADVKAVHPERATELFTALSQMIIMVGQPGDASRLDTLRRLASAEGSMTISLESRVNVTARVLPSDAGAAPPPGLTVTRRVTTWRPGMPLDQLPPELQQKVREALSAAGQAPAIEGPRQATTPVEQRPAFYCRHCGHSEVEPFDRCPHCGRRQRGFLARLLGR